jgi:hypothetical protein
LQAEVTRAWEAATTVEATHIMTVLAADTSTQEAAAAWGSTVIHVKDAEDQAGLMEREARERVSRVEAENAAALASAREDAEGLVRKIALLEGELVEARRAREVAEEKSRGLSNAVANAEHRWEVFEKECREHFEELILL